jgi:hypothetical protein
MDYRIIAGTYQDKLLIPVEVSGVILGKEKTFITTENNTRKTIDLLNQRIAEIQSEIDVNQEILDGIISTTADYQLSE